MFLKHLIYFANDPNYELVHKWHGINLLMVLECLLMLSLLWAGIALLATIKGKKKLKIASIITSIFFATAAYAANTSLSNLTASGAIAAANLIYVVQTAGSGGVKATFTQVATYINSLFSGDATVASGGAVTLATVNANVGSFGSATSCTAFTTNAKGLITAASQTTCTPAIASVTGLGTGVATALGNAANAAGGFITVGNAVSSITPGAGLVSAVNASCSQSALTTTGTLSAAGCVNAQVGTTYTMLDGDRAKLVTFSNAASIAVTLPQSTSSAFVNGWFTDVLNRGAGTVTITPTTSTINGTTTLVLTTGQGARIFADGTNYQAQAGSGSGGSGITSITPGNGLVSGVTASCTLTAITTSGTLSASRCINAQTGTTYTVLDTDRSKQVTLSNAAAIAVTLPQAGTASAFANGWFSTFTNIGVGTATITPTTSTINGASSYRLFSGQSITIQSDGTNYQIDPGTNGGVTVSSQTGANYAIVSSDFGKLINLSNAANQIPTLPNANTLGANWFVQVCNQGAGTQTITPATSTIGGAATFVLPSASAAIPACVGIVGDGTNYQVIPDFNMSASYLSAGTVAAARGGAGTINGALKGNGSGVVSQAACADLSNGTTLCSTTPGTGVATAAAANLSAAGGLTTTIASGTSALGTSAISSATCATVVTTAATNTATTDVVLASFNGDPTAVTGYIPATAGMLTIIGYPTANNVNFKVCNNTTSSITPGAITLNWRVVR